MLQKRQQNQPALVKKKSTDTIIGEGIIFAKNTLKGSGVIRIDGNFTGNIDVDGNIILSETGVLSGDIHAENAMLAGQFTGNANINNTLHLTATADLEGKIEAGSLIIDEGAAFSAACTVSRTTKRKDIVLDDDEQEDAGE